MKKTKPSKNAISLLMLLLSTLVLVNLPKIALASPTEIEVLSIWTEPEERQYWDVVLAKFQQEHTDITIKWTAVEMDTIYEVILTRNLEGLDPDVICMHAMWLPKLANYLRPIVAGAPSDVENDVKANFLPVAVKAATYRNIVYGYPTEFNSHALVYNKERLYAGTGSRDPPTTWSELITKARQCTIRDGTGAITHPGFMPYIDGNEEKRYEFMNLLWSNNGEFLDITGDSAVGTQPFGVPEALFGDQKGVEALELFESLSTKTVTNPLDASYNPDTLPDIYGLAWSEERVAMVVIPTWFTYVRAAMGANFDHLGIAPVPIGPSMLADGGTYPQNSSCVVYNWMMAVTERAKRENRADAAWTFLKWLNAPRTAGYIQPGLPVGPIPKGGPCSIIGDWLITDSVLPSRTGDLQYGKTSKGGVPVDTLDKDFWFKGFIDQAALYGRPDEPFIKSEEVQDQVGTMFERVASYGEDPTTVVPETVTEVNKILPVPGDINIDGVVSVPDAVLVIDDWDAEPTGPLSAKWNRGRADVNDDGKVSLKDGVLIVVNFGRTGDP